MANGDFGGAFDPSQYAPNVQQQVGHPYGASIWDLLRPNPMSEQAILQNVYGAGAIGQAEPSSITPPRSPLGQLLQGVGILGQPESRPLTPFEQLQYQEGQRYRSRADLQTESMREKGIAQRLGLAEKFFELPGTTQLPESLQKLYSPDELQQLGQLKEGIQQRRSLDLQLEQQRLDLAKARTFHVLNLLGQDSAMRLQGRELAVEEKMMNDKVIASRVKEYDDLHKQLTDPTQAANRANIAERLVQKRSEIVQAMGSLGATPAQIERHFPGGEVDALRELMFPQPRGTAPSLNQDQIHNTLQQQMQGGFWQNLFRGY